MSDNAIKVAETMARLRKEYLNQLTVIGDTLEMLLPPHAPTQLSRESMLALSKIAHRLAGSGTTFGMPILSLHGSNLEKLLLLIQDDPEKEFFTNSLQQPLINAIKDTLKACRDMAQNHESESETAPVTEVKEKKKILIVSASSNADIDQLGQQLVYLGYAQQRLHTLNDLRDCKPSDFVSILIHTNFSLEDRTDLQRWLDHTGALPPLLYLSDGDDFESRLASVQLKGTAFSKLPLDHIQLIDQLTALMENTSVQHCHVLVIDDDEVLAMRYALALESVGMTVTTLTRPELLMDVLSRSTIDLVLLDFHMPQCNGFELASILRQLNPYVTLPIIFLSTDIYLDQFMRKARLGIDDFLTKPVTTDTLISTVTERLSRALTLRRFMDQDAATGLLNHTRLEKELSLEVARAKRKKTHFSYAMLDIDHFKQINDSFGHATGDLVIRTLAHLLKQRLRMTDIIGRYGGEEFGIILPDTTVDQAYPVLNEIRQKFSEFAFHAGAETFHVTFSGGIAGFPDFNSELPLSHAADTALYEAKTEGRNRLTTTTAAMAKTLHVRQA